MLALANPGLGGGIPPGLWVLPAVVLILSLLFGYMAMVDLLLLYLPMVHQGMRSFVGMLCRPHYTLLHLSSWLLLWAPVGVGAISIDLQALSGGVPLWVFVLNGIVVTLVLLHMPFVRRRLRGKQPPPLVAYADLE